MRFGQVITVRRTQHDSFGDVVDEAAHTVAGCGVLHHSSEADHQLADQVLETATLAAPLGADITAMDEVTLADGTQWHVYGRPHVPHSPLTGWDPAVTVPIRRVTG